jgi:hypothetical protein
MTPALRIVKAVWLIGVCGTHTGLPAARLNHRFAVSPVDALIDLVVRRDFNTLTRRCISIAIWQR